MPSDDHTRETRRKLSTLMRLESRLAFRASRAQAGGVPLAQLGHVAAECWALRWAIEELSRAHPAAAEFARRGFERENERRRERRGATAP